MQDILCRYCNNKFQVWPSEIRSGKGKFCSKVCKNKAQITSNQKTCLICRKSFCIRLSFSNQGRGKYCSMKCRSIAYSRTGNPNYKGKNGWEKIEKICIQCNKTFNILKEATDYRNVQFCSLQCAGVYKRKTIINICLECGKEIKTVPSKKRQYCSRICSNKWLSRQIKNKIPWNKGLHIGWNKGKNLSNKHRKKISIAIQGQNNPSWKGNNVGYSALHNWIGEQLGKPEKCKHCGKDGLKGRQIQWANKSGKYKRGFSDWLRLCVKCHKKYDLGRRQNGQEQPTATA